MAGVEKICEFTGVHAGSDMHRFKCELIQVLPECRKFFRGAKHTLYLEKGRKVLETARAGQFYTITYFTEFRPHVEGRFFASEEAFNEHQMKGVTRIFREYNYCLVVEDESLLGNVNGQYCNNTVELPRMKRKLKRMLRCKKLNIVMVDPAVGLEETLKQARLASAAAREAATAAKGDLRHECRDRMLSNGSVFAAMPDSWTPLRSQEASRMYRERPAGEGQFEEA